MQTSGQKKSITYKRIRKKRENDTRHHTHTHTTSLSSTMMWYCSSICSLRQLERASRSPCWERREKKSYYDDKLLDANVRVAHTYWREEQQTINIHPHAFFYIYINRWWFKVFNRILRREKKVIIIMIMIIFFVFFVGFFFILQLYPNESDWHIIVLKINCQ